VILLCGIRSEPPLARVADELARMGRPVIWFDQRRAGDMEMQLDVADGRVEGSLLLGQDRAPMPLAGIGAVYVRTMDDRRLPEVERLPEAAPKRLHFRSLHDKLATWLEVTRSLVVNRSASQASNFSKPYQAQLIATAGFAVPDTLITSDPAAAVRFRERHGRVIYKSISGVRSIVKLLTDLDMVRIERLAACPVQFQAYIEGLDVRVHTIGADVFAARVMSWSTDYRYPNRSGGPYPAVEPYQLPDELAEQCLRLTKQLGLELAGIDLRITPSGTPVCFEVNPSPAYTYYEDLAGLSIAAAIARHLAAADDARG
jgi:glutathione synthase/RimK-type ligase-like ATP-grasp enzyme